MIRHNDVHYGGDNVSSLYGNKIKCKYNYFDIDKLRGWRVNFMTINFSFVSWIIYVDVTNK